MKTAIYTYEWEGNLTRLPRNYKRIRIKIYKSLLPKEIRLIAINGRKNFSGNYWILIGDRILLKCDDYDGKDPIAKLRNLSLI